jgi:hypothetical protein
MRTFKLCSLVGILLFPSLAFASGPDSLLIDGFYIRIGATKSEVRAKFDERYVVSDESDRWAIATNTREHTRFVCSIEFENGKAKSVSKHWCDYYVEAGGLKSFQALFSLVSNLTARGYTIAHVSTDQVRQPNLTADIITLIMANRKIEISIQNNPEISGDRIAVYIDETISK